MKLIARCALLAVLPLCLLATTAQAQPSGPDRDTLEARQQRHAAAKTVRARAGSPEGTGTVQYDPGSPTSTMFGNPNYIGNLFDTRNGQPLSSGTVTGISWYQGAACTDQICQPQEGTSTALAFVAVFPNTGTYNGFINYQVSGVNEFGFNSISASFMTNGSFFVGVSAGAKSEGPNTFGSIGVATGTYNNQGFHGRQRNWSGNSSQALPSLNAVVRVNGSIVIPVELLEFELE